MKNRAFKISVILVMILTMTMTNFIFVGHSLITYAADGVATNHKNVEFKAYFKDEEGNEVTTLEQDTKVEETFLYLHVNVKKEGYFNGEIALENSNFTLKESDSTYVSKIENNTIYLNQINVGTAEEIKVKIEPKKEENFSIGLLSLESKIGIKGIYRDSKQKDITIQGNREVRFKQVENNTEENVQNEIKVLTNKIVKMDGQEKRILQISYHMGLKENNYPIQEIESNLEIPSFDEKQAEVTSLEYLNNMTSFETKKEENKIKLTLKNEANKDGKVMWKTQGDETVIITCLYDKEVEIGEKDIKANQKITLYSGKEMEVNNQITIGEEELDSTIEINAGNKEEMIYKGKLNAGINRFYQSATQVKVNFAKILEGIELTEETSQYNVNGEEQVANVAYHKTALKKEEFDKIFGQEGKIIIYNQENEVIDTITNETKADEQGNIIISYEGKKVREFNIETTAPVAEGILQFNHIKVIESKEDGEKIKVANELKNTIRANGKQVETTIQLQEATTEATIEVNKESLSTIVSNNMEIKAVLTSNNEKYNLYNNPEIEIKLPEQVENIQINSVDLLYENELKIKDYRVEGRTLKLTLEGAQTQYKEETIQGATIIIQANVEVNRKAPTSDEEITMTYKNGEIKDAVTPIKIVAPTDITAIYSIQDLGIETIGQEQNKPVLVQRGSEEKQLEAQIEVINNQEETIEKAKILGNFPTNHKENNMEIEILKEIDVQANQSAKVYYSENENATEELENRENGWSESITNPSKVSKYLIVVDELETGASILGQYTYKIPANLEYNQTAKTDYQVKYANSHTKVENELASTSIEMQTGVGPIVETKLTATAGGKEINGPIRNGEVIRYTIQVANTGTEDVNDIKVTAKVPEGTTMVEPEEDYEYTGASYYEELDTKTYEAEIKTLKVGEVIYGSYEVRVNNLVAEGTTLSNLAQIKYGDVTKQSEEIKNVTAKGNLRVTVKRITDRSTQLYTREVVEYFAIVENISNQKIDAVKVQADLSANLAVETLTLYTGMKKEQGNHVDVSSPNKPVEPIENTEKNETTNTNKVESEILEYAEEINIGALEAGENKVLSYGMLITGTQDNVDKVGFAVTAKNGQEQYQSNHWEEPIKNTDVGISMTTNTQDQSVKTGDIIEYTIEVENKTEAQTRGVEIKDSFPKQLTIQKITQDGKEIEGFSGSNLILPITIAGNETSTIKVEAVVDYSEVRNKAEAITNVARAEIYGETVATTSEINHIIQANEDDSTGTPDEDLEEDENGNGNGTGNEGENDIGDNTIARGNRMITGLAWFDENANGQKDIGEKLLSNIKVRLLNTQTNSLVREENGKILETTTNENGMYVLDKIGNGEYIVIFDYDDSQYGLTKYKADKVSESENSNAILSELVIDDQREKVASTDILKIQDYNISNINIGLIKLEKFDLKLNKYVNKILIQDAKGSTVKEYGNETMAKVELDAKKINGSTVLIEYKIEVTNNGEVPGYAKKIADYATSDLKFSSELNKDWYQVGNTLYTTSLANEKIRAGETKTVTLTLTKAMTENSTGLIPNTAEIAEDYNELGIADSNSTPGNRAKGENDLGSAEVLISIRTGGVVYATITVIVVAILAIVAVVVIKKKNKQEEE